MSENEQPMIVVGVSIPHHALVNDTLKGGRAFMEPIDWAKGLSLSEGGVKISVNAMLTASMAPGPKRVLVWLSLTVASVFVGKAVNEAWDSAEKKLAEVRAPIEERMGEHLAGYRLDGTLPFEGGKVHFVIGQIARDDMAQFPLSLLSEEKLSALIRQHSPIGKVQRVNLRFHGSPPRLEVVSIHFASEGK